jgi:hypothetical protein
MERAHKHASQVLAICLGVEWRIKKPVFFNLKPLIMKLKILSLVATVALLVSCGGSKQTTSTSSTPTTATSTSSNAAYSGVKVPAGVQTSFTTQYPNATNVTWSTYDVTVVPIDWEMTGWPTLDSSAYMVRYTMDNNNYYGWYDTNGNWVGSTYVISDYKSLPAPVNSMLNSQYPGYTISSVQRESWKDHKAYEIKMQNGDNKVKLVVDDNGNILKQKTK